MDNDTTKIFSQLEPSFIFCVLKYFSSKENPLSAYDIAQYMEEITGQRHDQKTILRKLKKLCAMTESLSGHASLAMTITYGGYIRSLSNQASHVRKVQTHYYFEPLLGPSEISMINGAVASNRYIDPDDKEYLLSVQNLSMSRKPFPDGTYADLPSPSARTGASKESSPQGQTMLDIINQLYTAIENQYQIELVYGKYTLDPDKKRKVKLEIWNPDGVPYILNPYALLWNGGEYYLLCTRKGYDDNPTHYRVDRMISVVPHLQENTSEPEASMPLPQRLKPFFTIKHKNEYVFQSDRYTATYPLMGISREENLLDCYVECTTASLSILVDLFGPDIQILPSPLSHEENTDLNGRHVDYFVVRLPKVQYENIKMVCLQQHTVITAIAPQELVMDIADALAYSAARYEALCDKLSAGTPVNPFVTRDASELLRQK